MGVSAGLYIYVVVVQKFTFAISSPDEFLLVNLNSCSRSLLCCRPSVCRLCVTLVHPTQPTEIFGNVSKPFGTLDIRWHPWRILRRSSQGNSFVGGFKRKRGSQT